MQAGDFLSDVFDPSRLIGFSAIGRRRQLGEFAMLVAFARRDALEKGEAIHLFKART